MRSMYLGLWIVAVLGICLGMKMLHQVKAWTAVTLVFTALLTLGKFWWAITEDQESFRYTKQ